MQRSKGKKIFSTTGYTSRELYHIRKEINSEKFDFYNVGAMGHTSMVSLGYSIFSKKDLVICIDGDGALLMHMGSMALIGNKSLNNFKHILFNNGQHESVGGQKTPTKNLDFKKISLGFGYKNYFFSNSILSFKRKYNKFIKSKGPSFFEIKINSGTLKNLPRPEKFQNVKNFF